MQCNFFQIYNFHLVVCDVWASYVKHTVKLWTWEEWWVKWELDYQTTNLHTSVFNHQSHFWPIIPPARIILVTFYIFNWNITHT